MSIVATTRRLLLRERVKGAILPLLLFLCFGLTLHQAHVWRNEESIWKQVIHVSYTMPGPHVELGLSYQHEKRYEEAAYEYSVALALARLSGVEHDFVLGVGINMAKLLDEEHKTGEALEVLDILSGEYPESREAIVDIKAGILARAGVPCRTIRLLNLPCLTS